MGILEAMPKGKIPLDLFVYREELSSLAPVYRADTPLDEEIRKRLRGACKKGLLYVSRSQQDIYTDYITQQLDFVLQDKNLTVKEAAAIFYKGFRNRINEFFERPGRDLIDTIAEDCTTLCRYILESYERSQELLRQFICYLHKHNAPGHQRANVVFVALTLYLTANKKNINYSNLSMALLSFCVHDIGMTKVPEFIVNKPENLNPEERARLKRHPEDSMLILKGLGITQTEVIKSALEHHERWDGSGYPRGFKGDKVSLVSRVISIADSYSAMIEDKPYKLGKKPTVAAVELFKDKKRYDPWLTQHFLKKLMSIVCV
jgi:HD-GYP domain-containing protein (c-di-GMP phosphodiesterase class II)